MRINNNLASLSAYNSLNSTNKSLENTIQKLSTGLKINNASDDAAGFAISNKMRAQITGLDRAESNARDGISLLETAEGALEATNSMLQRMRELSVQAANDTLTSQDRSYIQMEVEELKTQIDSIARNTQFNNKALLDGSCCGVVTSTDTTTKAYVRGTIESEGNYKIEVRQNPGTAQIQKSTIFKIKHENVVTNLQTSSDIGIGNVEIDNVPAGDYTITATKCGGGEVTTTKKYVTTVNITNGNDSDADEKLWIRLTGENSESGTAIYWPYDTSYNPAERVDDKLYHPDYYGNGYNYDLFNRDNPEYYRYIDSSDTSYYNPYYYSEVTIPAGTSKEGVAQLIANKINSFNDELTMASDSNGTNATKFKVSAEVVNGDCKITATSTEGEMSAAKFNLYPGATTKLGYLQEIISERATKITAELQGRVDHENSSSSVETISIKVECGGDSDTVLIDVPAGTSAKGVADLLKVVNKTLTISGKSVTLTGEPGDGGDSYYTLKATAGDDTNVTITTSITSSSHTVVLYPEQSTPETSYSTTYKGTVSNSNTSNNIEKLRIVAYKGGYNGYIDVDIPVGTDEAGIAKIIAEKVQSTGSIKINGDRVLVEGKYSGTDSSLGAKEYTLKASGAQRSAVSFSVRVLTPLEDATTKITDNDASTKTIIDVPSIEEEADVEIAHAAVVNLTGFYGEEAAANSLSFNVDSNTQNNASVLFEVVNKSHDDLTGADTITLQASANIMTADGTNKTVNSKDFVFSSDNKTVNLGSLLGEDDDHFKLTLDPSLFDLQNKFVLSVSGNGDSKTPADTSLYVKGTQDSTSPSSWGSDDENYVTRKNNPIQYNVNAQAVTNRQLHFRNFYLNSDTGKVEVGDISMEVNDNFATAAANFPDPAVSDNGDTTQMDNTATPVASFTSNYVGKIADGNVKLRDLEQFWDNSGVFMLQTPQKISVTQKDGKNTSITLYASDTLNDLRVKLNNAISDDLGQGQYVSGSYANKFVTFVENPANSGVESVKGTFIIRSLMTGSAGELTFSSENGKLIDSLGLNTVQKSEESSYNVNIYNAHTNSIIASNVKTSGNILSGVIDKNIDIEFNPMVANATWSETDNNFIMSSNYSEPYTTILHVVKNNNVLQIGALEGDEVALDIGDMSSAGLGIKGVNLMTQDGASHAITILDEAINRVSNQRSKIGAYENTLETTLENLTTSRMNLTSAESRIRDADMSKEMLEFVKFQILSQSGTSMLAQANQLPQSVLSLIGG